jgi:hypothetical protein
VTIPPPAIVGPILFQPIVTDWAIPIMLLLVAALGKKLARTEKGWLFEDFYLGPDLCLAAVSTGLLKIFDLLRHLPVPADQLVSFEYDVALSAVLIVVTFIMFIYVLSEHRECTGTSPRRFARTRLVVECNLIGLASLTAFMILIKPLDMLK